LQARRILLLFAIGLALTAAAASLVPVPDSTQEEGESGQAEPEAGSSESGAGAAGSGSTDADAVELRFSAGEPPDEAASPDEPDEPDPPDQPPTETAGSGEHVIVTVTARDPGVVSLDGLGLVEPVGPRTPAVFDLFTDSTGEFDVLYAPVEGRERRVGTLAVVSEISPESGGAAEPEAERK